ncbi:ATP-binding cassette domain-containing protein [Lacticaseibacillus chiayiensis]|uniref:ATP-binding cassette domain-containing protein n=1 Tax=Lacticaseibacillus chiayiensis TaxID=2100821 RepID=A0ABY6H8S3_9LACO|nr:ATP-binding cassette domain-containing protein [Lacticaseibacillus chiayiensis]UYN57767.1 ATP-binding cassette domain-containing protein [Lacticaseibacillus chiayiensis]
MMIDYSNRIQSPLENIQFHSNNFQYLKGALSNLLEVENSFKEVDADGNYPNEPTIHVHINNLKNFNHQVLKQADMVISPGQIIGLSGVSGSGKSTLAKAIVGLQWQYGGYINYANVPISKISSTAMGENVSYVSVDQALFHASIENNLQGFAPLTGQETAWEHLARLHVPMPMLDYLRTTLSKKVGSEGENIDKIADGDRQLLLILRALLEEKDFIIMDETLSSLDNERFSDISNLLRSYATSHKIKVIVISHKSDRLLFADHVYSIANGEITYFSQLADWEAVYEGTTTC